MAGGFSSRPRASAGMACASTEGCGPCPQWKQTLARARAKPGRSRSASANHDLFEAFRPFLQEVEFYERHGR